MISKLKRLRISPGKMGQATVEFLVYLAILLALIAVFLPPLVRLADSSKGLAGYSTAKSATLKEAYFLSQTKLSGAEYAQPENFTIDAKSVYPVPPGAGVYPNQPGAGAYSAMVPVNSPFAINKNIGVKYNVE